MDVEVMSEVEKRWRNGTGGELIRGFLSEVEGSGGHVAWCWLPTASEGSWGECEPVVWPEQGVVVRTSFSSRGRLRCSLQSLEHSRVMVYHCFLVRWLQALLLPVVRLFDSLRVMLIARHFYW
jgi:hypothetical protein